MTCPRCKSRRVTTHVEAHKEVRRHSAIWWLFVGFWWIPIKWVVFLIPTLIIRMLRPKKDIIDTIKTSYALCKECGYTWKVNEWLAASRVESKAG